MNAQRALVNLSFPEPSWLCSLPNEFFLLYSLLLTATLSPCKFVSLPRQTHRHDSIT